MPSRVIMLLAGALTVLLAGHRWLPELRGATTMLESLLPWLGLAAATLLVAAPFTRSWRAVAAALVPAAVWGSIFGPQLLRAPPGETGDLTVATANLRHSNPDQARALRAVAANRDLLAVQELTGDVPPPPHGRYPYRYRSGTVALYSRFPLAETTAIDVGTGYGRALRAVVDAPKGEVTVYVVHLASARPGDTALRDRTLLRTRRIIARDRSPRLLLLGDLNTATTDRKREGLAPPLLDAHQTAGRGFGFTWPARFPITRPDHILYRGLTATGAVVERIPGSDHRAAVAWLRL
jgi:vancomycin resistance protein VanJ